MSSRRAQSLWDRLSQWGAYVDYIPGIGEEMAWIVYRHLTHREVRAFLDLTDLRPGCSMSMEEQKLRAIKKHRHFILILNQVECFAHLEDGNSALTARVSHALRNRRVIIPFVSADREFKGMLDQLVVLRDLTKVKYTTDYIAHALEQLAECVGRARKTRSSPQLARGRCSQGPSGSSRNGSIRGHNG